jgi:hypothetical protein
MLSNIFEMAVTIPIAVITLALHPHVCFAAVAMSAVSDTKKYPTFGDTNLIKNFFSVPASRLSLHYLVIR